jgi:hypothetical protein
MVQSQCSSLNSEKKKKSYNLQKNVPQINLDVSYANKTIFKAKNAKSLGLFIDSTRSWKLHTEQALQKPRAHYYAILSIKSCMSQEAMKMVHYA